jgi:hypothetical protein
MDQGVVEHIATSMQATMTRLAAMALGFALEDRCSSRTARSWRRRQPRTGCLPECRGNVIRVGVTFARPLSRGLL